MIDAIGDSAVQQTARIEHSQTDNQRHVATRETENDVEQRPVKEASGGADAKSDSGDDQSKTRYNIDHNRLVIEQYGKNGELILQLPLVHSENV